MNKKTFRCKTLQFIILIDLVTIYLSIEHFIPPPDECLLADLCNHTWIPECGKEKNCSNVKQFSDECHMHEYNCDNNKDYEKVAMAECGGNKTSTVISTTSSTTVATISTKTSPVTTEPITTIKPTTTITTPTMTTTISTTTPTTTTTTPTTTTTTSMITTTQTTTITPMTITTPTKITTTDSTHHNCSRNPVPPTPTPVKNCSNEVAKEPTQFTTTTDYKTTEPTNLISEHISTSTIKTSEAPIQISILEEETTKSDTKTSISITEEMKINTTVKNSVTTIYTVSRGLCKMRDCDIPSTWETTAKGEVRDFYQLLREKFGVKNVKLLKATTHWPRRMGWMKSNGDFVFGKHVDSSSNSIL